MVLDSRTAFVSAVDNLREDIAEDSNSIEDFEKSLITHNHMELIKRITVCNGK